MKIIIIVLLTFSSSVALSQSQVKKFKLVDVTELGCVGNYELTVKENSFKTNFLDSENIYETSFKTTEFTILDTNRKMKGLEHPIDLKTRDLIQNLPEIEISKEIVHQFVKTQKNRVYTSREEFVDYELNQIPEESVIGAGKRLNIRTNVYTKTSEKYEFNEESNGRLSMVMQKEYWFTEEAGILEYKKDIYKKIRVTGNCPHPLKNTSSITILPIQFNVIDVIESGCEGTFNQTHYANSREDRSFNNDGDFKSEGPVDKILFTYRIKKNGLGGQVYGQNITPSIGTQVVYVEDPFAANICKNLSLRKDVNDIPMKLRFPYAKFNDSQSVKINCGGPIVEVNYMLTKALDGKIVIQVNIIRSQQVAKIETISLNGTCKKPEEIFPN